MGETEWAAGLSKNAPAPPLPDETRWFGANLRRLRQDRGISLRDFAEQAEMSYSFLSNLERGKSDIRMGNAVRIAALLETTIAEMMEEPPKARRRIFRPTTRVEAPPQPRTSKRRPSR